MTGGQGPNNLKRLYAWGAELWAYALAIAAVALIGAVNLCLPFGPDQALVFHGAQLMDQGADYYVDVWDNKQPGLYVFYMLAGSTFGFSELGIHLFELLWMLAFTLVLVVTLRGTFEIFWMSAFVPLATVGVYYAMSSEHELTQLEFLVSLPLFGLTLCLLWAHRHPKAMAPLYFASGLLAGVVLVFKLMLAPLCAGLWLVALLYHVRSRDAGLLALAGRAVLPAGLGVALVLAAAILPFALKGHLDELLWTAFVYPPQALDYAPLASKSRLITAAGFFLSGFAPWALFAAAGVVLWVRYNRDLLGALMLVWIAIGIGLFVVQRVSWWPYHTLVILFPAGLLAIMGIDRLATWLCREAAGRAYLRPVIAGLLALTATAGLTGPLVTKAQPLLSTTVMAGKGIREYQSEVKVSEHYGRLRHGVRFLRAGKALPGPIYVFGNAMVYEFSGRASAHPAAGSSWEFYLPEQIDDILATLDRREIPYVLVDRMDLKLFRLRPKIAAYLKDRYVQVRSDASGVWFRRRGLAEAPLGDVPGNS